MLSSHFIVEETIYSKMSIKWQQKNHFTEIGQSKKQYKLKYIFLLKKTLRRTNRHFTLHLIFSQLMVFGFSPSLPNIRFHFFFPSP